MSNKFPMLLASLFTCGGKSREKWSPSMIWVFILLLFEEDTEFFGIHTCRVAWTARGLNASNN